MIEVSIDGAFDAAKPRARRRPIDLALAAALAVAAIVAVALAARPILAPQPRALSLHMTQHGEQASARPKTQATPISCVPAPGMPGKAITTAVVDFPPNAYTPRHRHPGPVTAMVIKGALRSQLAGGPVETFIAGQSWFEPADAIHLFAENASKTEPASLLTIFIADEGCPLIIFEPAP